MTIQTSAVRTYDIDPVTEAAIITLDGERRGPVARAKRTYIPLVCDVADTTITDAIASATGFIRKLHLHPGNMDGLFRTFDRISDWTKDNGQELLLNIVDEVAAHLMRDLVGVPDLKFQLPAASPTGRGRVDAVVSQADRCADLARKRADAYHVRYAITALRGAAVLHNTRHRRNRQLKDSLAYGLPSLPRLTGIRSRPLNDDELLLLRLLTQIDHKESEQPRSILARLVAESGVSTTESTQLDTTDLDHPSAPAQIKAPGLWSLEEPKDGATEVDRATVRGERTLPLSPYVATMIRLVLPELRHEEDTLTYNGDYPGHPKAHASLSMVLARQLRRAGITDPDVTAVSINRWRAMNALLAGESFDDVRLFLGGTTQNVLNQLKLDHDESELHHGYVTVREKSDAGASVRVPKSEFYDGLTTRKRRDRAYEAQEFRIGG